MVKSDDRNIEYYVVLQPRHREQAPIFMKGWSRNEEDAAIGAFNPNKHKEVLDVVEASNMEITEDICEKYWNMYGTYKSHRTNEATIEF